MSTGETPGKMFAANAHRYYFMLFAYFYLHHVLDKIPAWKLFTLTLMEKSKAEKNPWVKKSKKTGPKKKEIAPFCQRKKKNLAESEKGSWFRQTPSTVSASANLFGTGFAFAFSVFPIILRRRPELNSTERDKKCVAMPCFPREILVYYHRR